MMRWPLMLQCMVLWAMIPASGLAADGKLPHHFAVTGVLHPYFDPMEGAVRDFMAATGIQCVYRATQHFDQEEANEIIAGLVRVGYNGFAMWPGHPSTVNETIHKLVGQGFPVVLITGQAERPTEASLCIATDVGKSAAEATEHLISSMGGRGRIVNLLGQVNDPNVVIRKKAIEAVVDRYPDVSILYQLTEVDEYETARIKIGDFLASRGDEIDGLICTAYVGTLATAEILVEQGNRRIRFVGIDDDPVVIKAIADGYVTGTMTQSPYGQAYLGLEALRLLKKGYRPKSGVYFIDSGSFYISQHNINDFKNRIKDRDQELLEVFRERFLDPPLPDTP